MYLKSQKYIKLHDIRNNGSETGYFDSIENLGDYTGIIGTKDNTFYKVQVEHVKYRVWTLVCKEVPMDQGTSLFTRNL